MNELENDQLKQLDAKATIIYKFVTRYNDYIRSVHDYGTGEVVNMVEVHTLTFIEENPGVTVSKVALEWNRTKGAVSQVIKKLENRDFIYRKKEDGNAKNIHLYVTEKGKKLSQAHKAYDLQELIWADKILKAEFSLEEVDAFYKVMARYTKLLDDPREY